MSLIVGLDMDAMNETDR